jgi:hypothetical protein
MAIESLIALGIFTLGMLLVAIYDKHHRAEDHHDKKKDRGNHTR